MTFSGDAKVVPVSRISAVWGTSKRFTMKVIREAESRGLIEPQKSPSGREFLSAREWEAVSKLADDLGAGIAA